MALLPRQSVRFSRLSLSLHLILMLCISTAKPLLQRCNNVLHLARQQLRFDPLRNRTNLVCARVPAVHYHRAAR